MTKQQLAIVSHVCALGVGGVFLFAGGEKIWEPRQFAVNITNYRILPEAYANLLAIFLPWWEVAAGAAILHPATRRAGAWMIAGMLSMFICAVGYSALYKGLHIDCGCFGKGGNVAAGWKTIGFDAFLIIVTYCTVRFMPRSATLDREGAFPVDVASVSA